MTRPAVGADPETRFDRGARLVLIFALIFIALDIAQLAYRFTLPTEGWATNPDENDPGVYDFYLIENMEGAPSPLQPGDALHIIGGIPAAQILNPDSLDSLPPPPAGWQPGGSVPVTVIRDGQTLEFDIPIVNWTFAAWLRNNFADLIRLVEWLITLILFGVGLLTLLKRPGNLAGRFLFLFGLAVLAMRISYSLQDGLGNYFNPHSIYGKVIFNNVIFAYLFGPALLGFGLTFPHPKGLIKRHPWLLVAPFALGSTVLVLLFIAPNLAVIGFPITLGMILATIAALLHSALTMRDAISRAQLRWAVGGVMLGLGLFTLNFLTQNTSGISREVLLALASLGLPVMVISLAIAILRYRLFDIDLIIRRTLVYSLLTGLLALVYFGIVIVLQSLVSAFGGQNSALVTVVSTLAIAALFTPLRKRVQDFIDRRFYRRKYDAEKALADFAAAARSETDLAQLSKSPGRHSPGGAAAGDRVIVAEAAREKTMRQSHFDRGAWLHLVLVLFLLVFSVGTLLYRYTLPTDGWLAFMPDDINSTGYIYEKNILGAVSGLQPGDYVITVNAIPFSKRFHTPL